MDKNTQQILTGALVGTVATSYGSEMIQTVLPGIIRYKWSIPACLAIVACVTYQRTRHPAWLGVLVMASIGTLDNLCVEYLNRDLL